MNIAERFKRYRWLLAIVDQGTIAVTNLGLSMVFAHASNLSGLGAYSLLSVTMLSTLGLFRTLVSDPWLASKTKQDVRPGSEVRALTMTCAVSAVIPTAVVALLVGGGWSPWMLASIPAVLMIVQDLGRYAAYASERPLMSLTSDGSLLITLIVGVGVGWKSGHLGVGWVLGSWIIAYIASLLPLRRLVQGPIRFRGAVQWWVRSCRPLAVPLLHDSIAFIVSTNVSMYLLAALASKDAVGSIRVVTSLYSPISLVFAGLSMWLVPAFVRSRDLSSRRPLRLAPWLLLAGVAIWLTILLAIGPWLVSLFFGVEIYALGAPIIAGGLMTVLSGVGTIWLAAVKVHGGYRVISWARSISAVVVVLAVGLVSAAQTPVGYLGILALQNGVIAAVAGYLYLLHARSAVTESEAVIDDDSDIERTSKGQR